MKTLLEMQERGIDIAAAMERFMDNEEMYRKYLRRLPEEPAFNEMLAALEKQNIKEAFDCAHRLEGLLGNLSLTKEYQLIQMIVEDLRSGNMPRADVVREFQRLYVLMLDYVKEV